MSLLAGEAWRDAASKTIPVADLQNFDNWETNCPKAVGMIPHESDSIPTIDLDNLAPFMRGQHPNDTFL